MVKTSGNASKGQATAPAAGVPDGPPDSGRAREFLSAKGFAGAAPASDHRDLRLTELLDLVTRCIQLRGEVEMAKVEVEHIGRSSKAGEPERRLAEIRLHTLAQQLDVAEQLGRGEREVMQKELERQQKLHEAGLVSATEVERLGTYVQVLQRAF